jgi:hypothetical protein
LSFRTVYGELLRAPHACRCRDVGPACGAESCARNRGAALEPACHGVGPAPNPSALSIGSLENVARHTDSSMFVRCRRWSCRCIPVTTCPTPVQLSSQRLTVCTYGASAGRACREARSRGRRREERGGGRGRRSLDYVVGARQERRWNVQTQSLRSLEIDHQLELRRLLDRQIRGLGSPFKILPTKTAGTSSAGS